jgi:excisionase family DNA binding protein
VEKILYGRREAAMMLGVSLRTLDSLIALRQIAVRKIGRRVLVPGTALQKFAGFDHPMKPAHRCEEFGRE